MQPAEYEKYCNAKGKMTKQSWEQAIKDFLQVYKLSPNSVLTASQVI